MAWNVPARRAAPATVAHAAPAARRGILGLQRAIGNRAVTGLVQRSVGFEFADPSLVSWRFTRRLTTPERAKKAADLNAEIDLWSGVGRPRPFAKKALLHQGAGFKLELNKYRRRAFGA